MPVITIRCDAGHTPRKSARTNPVTALFRVAGTMQTSELRKAIARGQKVATSDCPRGASLQNEVNLDVHLD